MKLTRRDTNRLFLAGLFAPLALPSVAGDDWSGRIQKALDQMVPQDDVTKLTLTHYKSPSASVPLTATVELTWRPGLRRRGFRVSDHNEAMAVEMLLADIRQTFSEAIADPVA